MVLEDFKLEEDVGPGLGGWVLNLNIPGLNLDLSVRLDAGRRLGLLVALEKKRTD